MKKFHLSFVFTALVLLLASCGGDMSASLGIVTNSDLTTIRNSISLTYEYTETGTTFKWTKPGNLMLLAKSFSLSENSNASEGSTLKAKVIPSSYWPADSTDKVSIATKYSNVSVSFRSDNDIYLWAEMGSKFYNLGKFTTTTTAVSSLKADFGGVIDTSNTNSYIFEWGFKNTSSINARRFVISSDDSTYYSDPKHTFTCLKIDSSYLEKYYNDSVSISPRNYTPDGAWNAYKIFANAGSDKNSYYLWCQIEDGSWHNIGKFTFLDSNLSGRSTTVTR